MFRLGDSAPGGSGGASANSAMLVRRLKGVVRDELRLGIDVPIVIHEALCSEESCSPYETIIAVLDAPPSTFRIDLPLPEVTPQMVRELIRKHREEGKT